MSVLFDTHRGLLEEALRAVETRGFWTPFPEVPSGKIYGESARDEGQTAFDSSIGNPFELPEHPGTNFVGAEVSPWGFDLGITYPAAGVSDLIAASQAAAPAWAEAGPKAWVGVCLEILTRLNRMSFQMGHAVMHTSGQAFPMAFQAGGPHAQDRGLEAVAMAWSEMVRVPKTAIWEKPQGKGSPLVLEKHWQIMPRGLSLIIGCNTFPNWNSYPGLFASLATGNTLIVKPHPSAILPLALTVRVAREVLTEAGYPADTVLLAPDATGAEVTQDLVRDPAVRIIDYTGSNSFGEWVRSHAGADTQVYTEETGVNSIVIAATDDFAGMCANIAFSLSLYSGQMCTAPQNIFIPRAGIDSDEGPKSFDEVAQGISAAIDALLSDPMRASGVCGTLANPATAKRVANAHALGRVIRESHALDEGRSASPLILAVEAGETDAFENECFGPISFIVAVEDATAGVAVAADLAQHKGAITAALYDTNEDRISDAAAAFARAGVNLSINLTGNIYVNQSAAFSDFHVTGANPAGNASLTDAAFVANRFRVVMWRRPRAA